MVSWARPYLVEHIDNWQPRFRKGVSHIRPTGQMRPLEVLYLALSLSQPYQLLSDAAERVARVIIWHLHVLENMIKICIDFLLPFIINTFLSEKENILISDHALLFMI